MRRFGNYELVSLLSRGGMAEIFHARLRRASGFVKDVALKKILPEHNRNEEFVHLFVNEARVAARLHHANVVQVFDFGEVEGEYFIAMELVKGRDLRKLLKATLQKECPLSFDLSTHIMTQTLKGLSYAHEATDGEGVPLTIIHRDITPHNLLISGRGEVKISDFGIAKAAFTTGITAQGMVRGKLGYMSPEQVTGQPLSQKTDLFSAGAIFYEMFTGQRLYKGRAGRKLVQQIARGDPPDPKTLTAIPSALQELVIRLLDRTPDRRPSAREALEAMHSGGWSVDASLELSRFIAALDGSDSTTAAGPKLPNVAKKAPLSSTLKGTPQQRPRALELSPQEEVKKPALPHKLSLSERETVLLPTDQDPPPEAPDSRGASHPVPSLATPPLREQNTLMREDSDQPLCAAVSAKEPEGAAKKTLELPSTTRWRLLLRVSLILSATLSALFFGYALLATFHGPSSAPKKKSPHKKGSSARGVAAPKKREPQKKPWGRLHIPRGQGADTVFLDGLPLPKKAHRHLYVPAGKHLIQRAGKEGVSPPIKVKVIPEKTSR